VHLVGFITKKFVMMYGHTNVKFAINNIFSNAVTFCSVFNLADNFRVHKALKL